MTEESQEERHFARRNFFREGLREMFKPLADLLAERINNMPDFSSLTSEQGEDIIVVRPPGALSEEAFLKRCIRCGACALSCPYGVITILTRDELSQAGRASTYSWRPARETGTPRLDARRSWCRLCEDAPCAASCPAGALEVPEKRPHLGCAALNDETCLRAGGEDCRLCVEACPEGEKALRVRRNNELFIRPEGCTGCMACEHACPVEPPAVAVYPPAVPPSEAQ